MTTSTSIRTRQGSATDTLVSPAEVRRPLVQRILFKLARFVGRLFPFVVLTLAVTAGSLAYRLWAQASAMLPAGPPLTWVYDFGGWLAGPFERYESAPPVHEVPVVNLPVLIALDVFLFAGCALGLLTYASGVIAGLEHRPFKIRPERPPAKPRLVPAIRAASRNAYAFASTATIYVIAASRVAGARLVAEVKALDWPGYRRRAALALDDARTLPSRLAIAAQSWRSSAASEGTRAMHALAGLSIADVAAGLRRVWLLPPPGTMAWLTTLTMSAAGKTQRHVGSALENRSELAGQAALSAGEASQAPVLQMRQSTFWLTQQALTSATSAGSRHLAAYRLHSGRAARSGIGRRISRRRFLRLPETHS
jgi:hypothetical protein